MCSSLIQAWAHQNLVLLPVVYRLRICVEGRGQNCGGVEVPPPCDGVELISCLLAEWPELE